MVRGALALDFLAELRRTSPPHLEVWTDGAAVDGTRRGGGGYCIQWPAPGPDTVGSVAAGVITNSTAAEAAALAAALRVVRDEVLLSNSSYQMWLVFDSRALHDRLRRPTLANLDKATAEAIRSIDLLARSHRISIVWVPGHAGLPQNERADKAAKDGCGLPQPPSRPSYRAALSHLSRVLNNRAKAQYLEDVPPENIHRRISGGDPLPLSKTRSRQEDVKLFRLRANRAPFLQATLHRWGRAQSPECPHCGGPQEDTAHFMVDCPH